MRQTASRAATGPPGCSSAVRPSYFWPLPALTAIRIRPSRGAAPAAPTSRAAGWLGDLECEVVPPGGDPEDYDPGDYGAPVPTLLGVEGLVSDAAFLGDSLTEGAAALHRPARPGGRLPNLPRPQRADGLHQRSSAGTGKSSPGGGAGGAQLWEGSTSPWASTSWAGATTTSILTTMPP